ncbi:MAG: hypothetical protein COY09_00720 [Candidatus Portnoybacteria bacterium CG_4_10_14_0_2_um_filter_39_11]|uniref:Uncharacterized protein n=1 Tax=Candidatus Portnoybacteria bacterium CG_4_10_14_0_2_um_filter_39_11 TaxID=1974797 RepID=A0A2M7UJL1_9BACT|nr:MAG: hypothetical protein AUJ33_03355 [Parcubacteria group bacterium CG1_02_40_25]PIZ71417.1 MAG: hypothetical protein COY09_00720 [Candidatus Portnoybacteria bacterium CG_4_10_14_0_2_um_filter_39_11]
MSKNNLDRPLIIRDIQEVLIPAMEAVFATKKELLGFSIKKELTEFKDEIHEFKDGMYRFKIEMYEFKDEMYEFRDEMTKFKNNAYNFQDKVLKDLDTLLTEKTMVFYHMEKHRKMWQVVIPALEAKKILAPNQLKRIKALAVY